LAGLVWGLIIGRHPGVVLCYSTFLVLRQEEIEGLFRHNQLLRLQSVRQQDYASIMPCALLSSRKRAWVCHSLRFSCFSTSKANQGQFCACSFSGSWLLVRLSGLWYFIPGTLQFVFGEPSEPCGMPLNIQWTAEPPVMVSGGAVQRPESCWSSYGVSCRSGGQWATELVG
jgi:hypothetical protein